jgi:hypothetical protein
VLFQDLQNSIDNFMKISIQSVGIVKETCNNRLKWIRFIDDNSIPRAQYRPNDTIQQQLLSLENDFQRLSVQLDDVDRILRNQVAKGSTAVTQVKELFLRASRDFDTQVYTIPIGSYKHLLAFIDGMKTKMDSFWKQYFLYQEIINYIKNESIDRKKALVLVSMWGQNSLLN